MNEQQKPLTHPWVWKGLWQILLGVLAFRTLQSAYIWDAPWFALSCGMWGVIGYVYGRLHEHYAWVRDPENAQSQGASWRTFWSKLDA